MSELSSYHWDCNGVPVRNWPKSRMVALTDLWKAADRPASLRPDKWLKSHPVQQKLEDAALLVGDAIERDKKGKVSGVPGVLEIVRGGHSQGTFASYDLAIEYTGDASQEVYKWFTGVLHPDESEQVIDADYSSSENVFGFPIGSDEFESNVRITPDGRVSVYDAIGYTTAQKNPRDVWNELTERFPEVVGKTDNFQFSGQGQRPTPVATLEVFLEIVVLLPGRIAATIREKAVRNLVRVMNGDPSLIDEILDRIQDPRILADLESSINIRRKRAFGDSLPSGTTSEPLVEITSEIKDGYGWRKRTEEMTDLLVKLATHVGDMVIQRESPHRSYGGVTGKSKSRVIPLILRTLRNMDILHVYQFENTYIDDSDVVEVFQTRAYPELAYRDFRDKGVRCVVAHLVSPAGITKAGVERLHECQGVLDRKYKGAIRLDAMRLDELVWGEMYPAIEERYRDTSGKFASHHLNRKIKTLCSRLCSRTPKSKLLQPSGVQQLSLFGELLSEI